MSNSTSSTFDGYSGTMSVGQTPPVIPFVIHFTATYRDGTQRSGVRIAHNSTHKAAVEDFWSGGMATKDQAQRACADVQEIRIHKVDRADLEGDVGLPAVPVKAAASA